MIGLLLVALLAAALSSRQEHPSLHDEYANVCGWGWQRDFIQRQEMVLSGTLPPKYVIAIPGKFGLADLVHGYLTAFIIALATDRAFLIARVPHLEDGSSAQNTIEFAYHSPHIVSEYDTSIRRVCGTI